MNATHLPPSEHAEYAYPHSELVVTPREAGMLDVSGEIDRSSSQLLDDAIRIAALDAPQLRLDMRGVTFIDSSGLALLIRASKLCETVRVVNPSPVVERLLRVTSQYDRFVDGAV